MKQNRGKSFEMTTISLKINSYVYSTLKENTMLGTLRQLNSKLPTSRSWNIQPTSPL